MLVERMDVRSTLRLGNGRELMVAPDRLMVEGRSFAEAIRRSRLGEGDSGNRVQEIVWEAPKPENKNQNREEKLVVIMISVGKKGRNWEALPHKVKQVKGWVDNWTNIDGMVSSRWDD